MGVRVKIARDPLEIRRILEVRHKVFIEEEKLMPPSGGVMMDLFDALPTTVNFVALDADEVIGGCRLTLDSPAGMPADHYFDFRAHLPSGARVVSCSMLCLRNAYRGNPTLIAGMLMMGCYWAKAKDVTHFCSPVNPAVEKTLARSGVSRIAEPFTTEDGLPVVPMVMNIAEMTDAFVSFIERQNVGVWTENFEREFYRPGEVIVQEGERGDKAYVLVEGEVAVLGPGEPADGKVVASIPPGELFGEVALLTERKRTATVVAKTPASLMVLDRDTFQRELKRSPDIAWSLLSTIGARLHDTVTRSGRQD